MIISGPAGTEPSVTNTSSNIVFEYYYKNQEAYQLLLDDVNVWAKPYYCMVGLDTPSGGFSSSDYEDKGVYIVPDFDITQYPNGYNSPEPYKGQLVYKDFLSANKNYALYNYLDNIGRIDTSKENSTYGSCKDVTSMIYHGENYKIIQIDSWGTFHELGTISSPTADVYKNVTMAVDNGDDAYSIYESINPPDMRLSNDKNYFLLYVNFPDSVYWKSLYFYYYFEDRGKVVYANSILIDDFADDYNVNPAVSIPLPLINLNDSCVTTILGMYFAEPTSGGMYYKSPIVSISVN